MCYLGTSLQTANSVSKQEVRRGAVFVLQVCSGRSGCRGPAVWSSLRTWTAGVGGGCEVMSACWPESCRGCSYPGTVWGRLEDTDFKLLTVFTHITSKRGLKESTFIAGLDSFNTHSQSCPASALLTSCGYSSCRRALQSLGLAHGLALEPGRVQNSAAAAHAAFHCPRLLSTVLIVAQSWNTSKQP